jgi:hypothetical protein
MIAEVLKINVGYGAENDPKDLARIKQVGAQGARARRAGSQHAHRAERGERKRTAAEVSKSD